jgi:hypothetical protein
MRKLLSILFLVLIMSSLFVSVVVSQQDDTSSPFVSCTVKYKVEDVFAIFCEDTKNQTTVAFGVKESDIPEAWRSRTQAHPSNTDVPLLTNVMPVVGQILQATIVNGEPIAVPPCEVQIWRKVKNFRSNAGYDRTPGALLGDPDGCIPQPEH